MSKNGAKGLGATLPSNTQDWPEGRLTEEEAAVWVKRSDPGEIRFGKKRVAMVGFALQTRGLAPLDDPDIEVWTLNEANLLVPRFDRVFQIHPRWWFADTDSRDNDHIGFLRSFKGPVVTMQPEPDIPTNLVYPLKEVCREFSAGVEYFTSTFCYMMGLALLEGYTEIGVYGIDMADSYEYKAERAGVEFWLGIALGRGVRLVIPEQCPLLKGQRYGTYSDQEISYAFSNAQIETRAAARASKLLDVQVQANRIEAQIQECRYWQSLINNHEAKK